MTDVRVLGHRLLALHFDDASCAVLASDLVAIDHDGMGARISVDGPLCDLADHLPHCSSSAPPMRLIVEVAGQRRAFRACAQVELVETSHLYRMPRALRELGCASWLRGIAMLDDPNHDGTAADGKRPALWLDLTSLALVCDGPPANPKEIQ